ncbi:MAG: hypothetical protein RLW61_19270 [Gammaproteobacteria bacterium]
MSATKLLRTRLAGALLAISLATLAACSGERGAASRVASECDDVACLEQRDYVCEVVATGFHHCTCRVARCAATEEFICMDTSCVVKPFDGPVTGALLEALDPGIYRAQQQGS